MSNADHIELGDQRASDLIDQAEAEFLEHAIKLLERALAYGDTGLQAQAAYLGLGMRYEELGDEERAHDYYTKSIETPRAGQPNENALFWRGQILYRRGEFAKAKRDFELAVNLGLYSPEREQAQAYLTSMTV